MLLCRILTFLNINADGGRYEVLRIQQVRGRRGVGHVEMQVSKDLHCVSSDEKDNKESGSEFARTMNAHEREKRPWGRWEAKPR
jgi:hypothetical protein